MQLPQFNHIVPSEIQPKLEEVLASNLKMLEEDSLADPISLLENMENRLQLFWSPIAHLHAVKNTPEIREVYQQCLPLLSDYATTLSHHEKLYQAFKNYKPKDVHEARIVELSLRDFHLSGVDLPADKKAQYKQIEKELAELQTQFGVNLLDATQSWEYQATVEELEGIPAHLIPEHNKLTLDYPCYSAIQKYAENRELREKCYHAFTTRASAEKYDNTDIMYKILLLRFELAQLLGFNNYAELSLATKMVKTPQEVLGFLNNLVETAKPMAEKELQDLEQFAGKKLAPWDIAYYSEKLSLEKYHIDQEMFRPYFSVENVLAGLFTVVNNIYGIHIQEINPIDTWHEDVRCYEIYRQAEVVGIFYVDLYARKLKREGAWMDHYCSRWKTGQLPVAYLTCNFLKAKPQLTHDDVITLFHEFGHGLHHLLTQIDRIDISGIAGVAWDAVELPSQFMENFCWQKEVLALLSNHTLPQDLVDKLLASRHFQAALQLIRQLEFGLFDFNVHLEKPDSRDFVMRIYNKVSTKITVIKKPDYVRFPHSFSHIFDGGYSAGYYSYLWAEVLSCDVFSVFEEKGIFNLAVGQHFLDTLLSQGGSKPAEILFKDFRGRAPDNKAFLKSWGLIA